MPEKRGLSMELEREDTAQKQPEKKTETEMPQDLRDSMWGNRAGGRQTQKRQQGVLEPDDKAARGKHWRIRDPRKRGKKCWSRIHGHRERRRDRDRRTGTERLPPCTLRGSVEWRERQAGRAPRAGLPQLRWGQD